MNPTLTSQSSELSSFGAASRFRQAKIDPREDGNTVSVNAAAELEAGQREIAETQELTNAEFDLLADIRNVDEFTPSAIGNIQDKDKNKDEEKRRKRRERRIGVTRKVDSNEDDYDEEDVYGFLGYLDRLWKRLAELVQDVSDEFDNWNKWFKKEKRKPPVLERSRVTYIRDEYQVNRSPHLWKSDPNRNWVLGFGHTKVNNIVSSILYKYQNETISKDA